MKRSPLKRTTRLKARGSRGKRLAQGDSEISREFRAMRCYCGCNEEPDPCHLESRRYESSRHNPQLIIPLCRALHDWLDHTAEGVTARAQMLALARERALTPADIVPLLVDGGAFEYKARGGAGCLRR